MKPFSRFLLSSIYQSNLCIVSQYSRVQLWPLPTGWRQSVTYWGTPFSKQSSATVSDPFLCLNIHTNELLTYMLEEIKHNFR